MYTYIFYIVVGTLIAGLSCTTTYVCCDLLKKYLLHPSYKYEPIPDDDKFFKDVVRN